MNPAVRAETRFRTFFERRGWTPFAFQEEMLRRYTGGYSGLLNAPTGSGKTLAMWLPILSQAESTGPSSGLRVLWISPLRALAQDAVRAMQEACQVLEIPWRVEMLSGDTPASVRLRQRRNMPECLVTTPESLHMLLSHAGHEAWFNRLEALVADEWHELMGSKRGTQWELAAARLRSLRPGLKVWGISATLGNMEEALDLLLGTGGRQRPHCIVRAELDKKLEMHTLLPEPLETFPWAGHLGAAMVERVLPVIEGSRSTLLFTNTRAQAELWYQALLQANPEWAGLMALHHGSLSQEVRSWVEQALHEGRLKLVVCTASLDLGVDFRPVETVIQVGGPKGIARFMQRAGRAGHAPGAVSRIWFVPTHSLELVEAAALRRAIGEQLAESRPPVMLAYDVLAQYMVTRAVGGGFAPDELFREVRGAWSYQDLSTADWLWLLNYISNGGDSLQAYEEFKKVVPGEDGIYRVESRKVAARHRLSMGTIVSDEQLQVKWMSGGKLGTVEERFIATVEPGESFWLGGRCLELVRVRGTEVLVKKSKQSKGKTPSWQGARMPLSSQMSALLRDELDRWAQQRCGSAEMQHLEPLLTLQQRVSRLPDHRHFLIERLKSREGYHLFLYPFEGRIIHEMLGALFAWRISRLQPQSFSIAMNDYGLELLSDKEIPLEKALEAGLLSTARLDDELARSVNETLMAQKKFHEIAHIAGLMFRGLPGRAVSSRHLHATSGLLFRVFREHDPGNLLYRQAFSEVIDYQIDDARLRRALARISSQQIVIQELQRASPFAFPIMVDRLRERLSSEALRDRIARMHIALKR